MYTYCRRASQWLGKRRHRICRLVAVHRAPWPWHIHRSPIPRFRHVSRRGNSCLTTSGYHPHRTIESFYHHQKQQQQQLKQQTVAPESNQNENKQAVKKHNENVIQTILQWEKKNNSLRVWRSMPHDEQPMKLMASIAAE